MRFLLMTAAAQGGVAIAELRPMASADVTLAAGWATLTLTATGADRPIVTDTTYVLRAITSASERAEIGNWLVAGDAPADGVSTALSPPRAHIHGSDRVEDYRFVAGTVVKYRTAA